MRALTLGMRLGDHWLFLGSTLTRTAEKGLKEMARVGTLWVVARISYGRFCFYLRKNR